MRLSTRLLCWMGREHQELSLAERSRMARDERERMRQRGHERHRRFAVWLEASIRPATIVRETRY